MVEQKIKSLVSTLKKQIKQWEAKYSGIKFVYNEQLDDINIEKVKYILVADNPGKNEKEHNRYLVGEAGVAARCLFKAELGVKDFDKEVIVLNKTPICSNTTKQLLKLYNAKSKKNILIETQKYMSKWLFKLHALLKCEVLIVGFSGCRQGGKWNTKDYKKDGTLPYFFEQLKAEYKDSRLKDKLYLYKHFSMMQFFRDISNEIGYKKYNQLQGEILKLGKKYREELTK